MMTIELELSPLRDKKLLAAVSGGADSMCLLMLLTGAGLDVTAAHYEHGIRGEESLRDMRFVEDFCRARHIPCLTGRGDAPGLAAGEGLSLEEAARRLRYAFLESCADAIGADWILTAHNLDDNAETLLMNLTRGAAGARGIPARRGRILRPLLSVSRAEIESWLEENKIPHIEDSSNAEDTYTRNLIRHRVVPALREINPRFSEAAARACALSARDEEYFQTLASAFLEREYRGGAVPLEKLRALHPAVASRVLRTLLPGLSAAHTEAALAFLGEDGPATLDLPGIDLRRERGRLRIGEGERRRLPERSLTDGVVVDLPEAGLRLRVEMVDYHGEIHDLFKTSFLKYEMIHPGLFCTARRPGDRIRPLGRGCTKRFKALFEEAGIEIMRRDSVPVIRDEEGPLLLYGLALDERARPVPGEKAWKLSFSKLYEMGEGSV